MHCVLMTLLTMTVSSSFIFISAAPIENQQHVKEMQPGPKSEMKVEKQVNKLLLQTELGRLYRKLQRKESQERAQVDQYSSQKFIAEPSSMNEIHQQFSDINKVIEYLNQFGYLISPSNLRTLSKPLEILRDSVPTNYLKKALMKFQEMAGLPQSGILDKSTKAKMTLPRCGLPDIASSYSKYRDRRSKRFIVSGSKWSTNSVTYRVGSYPRAELNLSNDDVMATVRRALQYWSDASSLSFVEMSSDTADIQIYFSVRDHGDGSPFDGPGGILAHAYFPGAHLGGDLHWDGDEPWTINSSEGKNLLYVTTHELGHALGLAHSTRPDSIMQPFYQDYNPNFVLGQDDVRGIQKLYGPPLSITVTQFPSEMITTVTESLTFPESTASVTPIDSSTITLTDSSTTS